MPKNTAPFILDIDSVSKTESGAIDLTKAKRIAEGGTHVLYRFPNSPLVIKLMKQNPTPNELDELEKKYDVLYDSFDRDGKQRCIREFHITHLVLLPGEKPQNAALSIVPYEKCFNSKTKFDFKMEPAELDPYLLEQNAGLFEKANKALIHKGNSEPGFSLNDYGLIDERIGAILQRLDSDHKLRHTMIEFLNHYRDFYQKTNIILDAMGFENILFFQDETGDWQFKVGSAIKHDTGKYTNQLFEEIHAGNNVALDTFVNFTHAYFSPANIRAVNVCAMKLGLEPVIDDVNIDSKDLIEISKRLSVPERMLAYARHGDFKKMEQLLQENKEQLSFNLRDFWTYSRIADEYILHGKPPKALKNYLDIVSELTVVLPESKECGLIKLSTASDAINPDTLKSILGGKPSYLLFNEKIYYIDEHLKWDELSLKEGDKDELNALFPNIFDEVKAATTDSLIKLTSLTGHSPNMEDKKRIVRSKTYIEDRKNMHDNKILIHQELTTALPKVSAHDEVDSPTKEYRNKTQELRETNQGYQNPSETSQAQEGDRFNPSQITPKSPRNP